MKQTEGKKISSNHKHCVSLAENHRIEGQDNSYIRYFCNMRGFNVEKYRLDYVVNHS